MQAGERDCQLDRQKQSSPLAHIGIRELSPDGARACLSVWPWRARQSVRCAEALFVAGNASCLSWVAQARAVHAAAHRDHRPQAGCGTGQQRSQVQFPLFDKVVFAFNSCCLVWPTWWCSDRWYTANLSLSAVVVWWQLLHSFESMRGRVRLQSGNLARLRRCAGH